VTHEYNLHAAEDKVILSFKKCTPILLPSRKVQRILCSVISISPEKWFWVAVGSYEEEAMMVQAGCPEGSEHRTDSRNF
jgi:hypothetical protein